MASKSTIARALLLLLLAATLSLAELSANAEAPAVPLPLQVDLTVKLLEYAQAPSPQAGAGGLMHIGILVKSGSVESQHAGTELKAALGRVARIAGVGHEEITLEWSTAAAMAEQVKSKRLFAVYLTPGLGSDVPSIAYALVGTPVITIGAIDTYVAGGALLGFELTSGRPKMVFNLGQAKRQGVVFRASVMKLMRIIE